MKGLMVFSSLITGMVLSVAMATSQATTFPVMESHGSLKISTTTTSRTDDAKSDQDLKNERTHKKEHKDSYKSEDKHAEKSKHSDRKDSQSNQDQDD